VDARSSAPARRGDVFVPPRLPTGCGGGLHGDGIVRGGEPVAGGRRPGRGGHHLGREHLDPDILRCRRVARCSCRRPWPAARLPSARQWAAILPAAGGEASLSEALAQGQWTAGTLPLPAPTPYATLAALSCPAPGQCVAVGSDVGVDHTQRPVAETLSGKRWTAAALSLPAGSVPDGDGNPILQGVSCVSTASCVAVGYAPGSAFTEHPMAEVLTGGRWEPVRLPLPRGAAGHSAWLSGVSCVTATNCVAVGTISSEKLALVETLSVSGWTATSVSPPANEPRVWLSSVSCVAVGSCRAAGPTGGATRASPVRCRPGSRGRRGTPANWPSPRSPTRHRFLLPPPSFAVLHRRVVVHGGGLLPRRHRRHGSRGRGVVRVELAVGRHPHVRCEVDALVGTVVRVHHYLRRRG
jgi:hypothetical protein